MAKTKRIGQPAVVVTTVALSGKLWERAKVRAVEEHTSLRQLIVLALEAYLKGGRS